MYILSQDKTRIYNMSGHIEENRIRRIKRLQAKKN